MKALIVVAVVAVATASVAADQQAALEVAAPTTAVSVGDRITVRITARGGEGRMWGVPRVATTPDGPWEVVVPPHEVAGVRPPAWDVVLAPMEVGELDLPVIAATLRPRDGDPSEVVADGAPVVTVASVLPADGEVAPAPLRPPIGVQGFPWEWVLPLAVPILGLAAAFGWWGTRRRRANGVSSGPMLPPFEELESLAGILEDRIGRDPVEGICDRLSGGLRCYLERRCGEPAQEMTSSELRMLARALGWPEGVQRNMQGVTGLVDGVRFGRRPVTEEDLRRSIRTAVDTGRGLEEFLIAEERAETASEAVE
ncbi:MAG: hypothetical protein ACC742_06055 [Thermoanaerobaculales bacterium]